MSKSNLDVKTKFVGQEHLDVKKIGRQNQIWMSKFVGQEHNLDVKTKFIGQEQVWTLKPNLDVKTKFVSQKQICRSKPNLGVDTLKSHPLNIGGIIWNTEQTKWLPYYGVAELCRE